MALIIIGGLILIIAVAACRQPGVKFFTPVTIFNCRAKLTTAGSTIYIVGFIIAILGVLASFAPPKNANTEAQASPQQTTTAQPDQKQIPDLPNLPKCDQNEALQTLGQAVDRSQFARTLNLSFVEATNIAEEQGYQDGKRHCTAKITFNNMQTVPIKFFMEARDGGRFLIGFQVIQ